MARTPEDPRLAALPAWTHTQVKNQGVRELVDQATSAGGALQLRQHRRTTAVVLSPQAYLDLLERAAAGDAARAAMPSPVAQLRARFDERLELLQRRGATDRLEAAFEADTGEMSRVCEMPMLAG